jgi:hypothetical protein
MDTQLVKLLKIIRKAKGQAIYNELCQNPLYEKSLFKLQRLGYIAISPISGYGEPLPEAKVYITPEGENFLLDQSSLAVKESISRILVPTVIGVLMGARQ